MCPGPEKQGLIIKLKQKGGGVTELIFCLAFILFSLIAYLVQFWKAAPHFAIPLSLKTDNSLSKKLHGIET